MIRPPPALSLKETQHPADLVELIGTTQQNISNDLGVLQRAVSVGSIRASNSSSR